MTVRACAFDLGNTLVNDKQLQLNSLKHTAEWMKENGFLKDPEQFISTYLGFNKANLIPFLSHTFGEKIFFDLTLNELGISGIDTAILLDRYRSAVMDRIAADDDVIEAITYLRDRSVKTAILSNESTERVDAYLKKTHMEHLFDSVIVSKTIGIEKPDPKIFEEAQARLDVPFEEIVMFGDNEIADGACKQLGMIFVFVRGYKDPNWGWEKGAAFKPDHTIDYVTRASMEMLMDTLEKDTLYPDKEGLPS